MPQYEHGGTPWSPLTSSEATAGAASTRDLRDEDPYLSVIEFVFSPTLHPDAISIPEFVAREVMGEVEDPRRTPMQVAEALIQHASACLGELGKQPATAAAPGQGDAGVLDFATAAALELEAMAHLGRISKIVFLEVDLETLKKRIHNFESRGIAKAEDQSFGELFGERRRLYQTYADITIDANRLDQEQLAARIAETVSGF